MSLELISSTFLNNFAKSKRSEGAIVLYSHQRNFLRNKNKNIIKNLFCIFVKLILFEFILSFRHCEAFFTLVFTFSSFIYSSEKQEFFRLSEKVFSLRFFSIKHENGCLKQRREKYYAAQYKFLIPFSTFGENRLSILFRTYVSMLSGGGQP